MKNIKFALFIILSMLAVLMASCQQKTLSINSEKRISPNDSIDLPEPVNVNFATDDILSAYDSFNEFVEFKDEGYQKIVFTTNNVLKDFRFIEICHVEKDLSIALFENATLYSLGDLLPEKPFVVTWMEQGLIPHRGIAFTDENNVTKYFYISMSGEDGSLSLIEIEPQ